MPEKTILIAEDNAANMKLIVVVLRSAGYTLLTVQDGQAAIDTALREKPDLILMDLQLPFVSGYAATQVLKDCPQTADIPIVALTAHALAQEQQQAQQAGFDGYITKPIDTRTFPQQICKYFRPSPKAA